jgi:hypothetical protein
MNAVRLVISIFIAVLIAIATLGWKWTSAHQAPAQATASHLALGLSIVAGIVGVITIWRPNRD